MAKPLIPFVKNGYYASLNWTPLVNGNGLTAGGGDEPEPDPTWETVTGNPVTFETLHAAPLRSLSLSLSPIQSLNGYSNPWPAGGGKNKLKILSTTETINDVTFTVNADGSVKVNGTASAAAVYSLNDVLDQYLEHNATYILNGSPTNSDQTKWKLRVYNGTNDYIDEGSGVSFKFNATSQAKKCDIVVYAGTHMDNVVFWPMIRLSTVSDATFSPYSNICPISGWDGVDVFVKPAYDAGATPTVSISFPTPPGTVYSGTLGVLTGVLTVDYGYVDLGEKSWSKVSGIFYTSISDIMPNGHPICSQYRTSTNVSGTGSAGSWADFTVRQHTSSHSVYIKDSNLSGDTTAQFKSDMSGVQLVYELAEPLTYQLTPQEVSSLLGQNVVWSNANGDLTVEYRSN